MSLSPVPLISLQILLFFATSCMISLLWHVCKVRDIGAKPRDVIKQIGIVRRGSHLWEQLTQAPPWNLSDCWPTTLDDHQYGWPEALLLISARWRDADCRQTGPRSFLRRWSHSGVKRDSRLQAGILSLTSIHKMVQMPLTAIPFSCWLPIPDLEKEKERQHTWSKGRMCQNCQLLRHKFTSSRHMKMKVAFISIM